MRQCRVSNAAEDEYIYFRKMQCLCSACRVFKWNEYTHIGEVGPWIKHKLKYMAPTAATATDVDDDEEAFIVYNP